MMILLSLQVCIMLTCVFKLALLCFLRVMQEVILL